MAFLLSRRRAVIAAIKTLVALGVLYLLFRVFEHVQVYQPRSRLAGDPSSAGMPFREAYFPSVNGNRLHAWFVPAPPDSAWGSWAVLVSHGNGGNISHRLGLYRIWHDEGFCVLAYDYQGYGRSGGFPTEGRTYQDVQSAYQWLIGEGFAPERILPLGESLGGSMAAHLAAGSRTGGLVLQSAFTSLPDLASGIFPWLPVRTLGTHRVSGGGEARLGGGPGG